MTPHSVSTLGRRRTILPLGDTPATTRTAPMTAAVVGAPVGQLLHFPAPSGTPRPANTGREPAATPSFGRRTDPTPGPGAPATTPAPTPASGPTPGPGAPATTPAPTPTSGPTPAAVAPDDPAGLARLVAWERANREGDTYSFAFVPFCAEVDGEYSRTRESLLTVTDQGYIILILRHWLASFQAGVVWCHSPRHVGQGGRVDHVWSGAWSLRHRIHIAPRLNKTGCLMRSRLSALTPTSGASCLTGRGSSGYRIRPRTRNAEHASVLGSMDNEDSVC